MSLLGLTTNGALPRLVAQGVTGATAAICCQQLQFHSSRSCLDEESSSNEQSDHSTSSSDSAAVSAAAGAKRRGPVHAPYLPLDDEEFNMHLRYNTDFVTDPDRSYAIGHRQAFDRLTRQELRKALAAQRLILKDTAAAVAAGPAGAKQLPLRDQMQARLVQMQDAMASR